MGIGFIAVSPCTSWTVQDNENRVEFYCWGVLGVVSDTGRVKFQIPASAFPEPHRLYKYCALSGFLTNLVIRNLKKFNKHSIILKNASY